MRAGWLIAVVACLALVSCQEDVTTTGGPAPSTAAHSTVGRLLHAASGGDGDSWKDSHGVEYRLGLVNTPELSECYGETASRMRKQLTASGFRATSYTTDQYGRHVSVVYLADGRNLNVWLALNGYANDRYLKEFRHENPSLAALLDPAFAAARREHLGLWGACGSTQAPAS